MTIFSADDFGFAVAQLELEVQSAKKDLYPIPKV